MTDNAAGMDIFSANEEPVLLRPKEVKLIPAGFVIALPPNFEAQIRPRSGLALKNKVTVLNSPGTIDPDYRGEVKIIMINLGSEDFLIEKNMRIAQMVISRFEVLPVTVKDCLDSTERGDGGFGHTNLT